VTELESLEFMENINVCTWESHVCLFRGNIFGVT